MKTNHAALAAIFLSLSPAVALSQQMPAMVGYLHPRLGAWAEYDVLHEGGLHGPMHGRMRVAIVGREGDAWWIETKMHMEMNGRQGLGDMISKALVSTDSHTVKRLIVKSPMGVREMSPATAPPSPDRRSFVQAGSESITVPAGAFNAKVITYDGQRTSVRSWLSEGVGPWGVVKMQAVSQGNGGTTTMTLLAHGGGATSEVDETQAQPMANPYAAPDGQPQNLDELRQRAIQMQMEQLRQQQGGN